MDIAAAESVRGTIVSLLRRLLGERSHIEFSRVDRPGSAPTHSLISDSAGPRWLIPNTANRGEFAFKAWRPWSRPERLLWQGLGLGRRHGLLSPFVAIPKLTCYPSGGGLLSRLQLTSTDADFAIYLGRNKLRPKACVMLYDPHRDVPSRVVKMPLCSNGVGGLECEHQFLELLEHQGTVCVPKPLLLHEGEEPYAVQSFVSGEAGRDICTGQHVACLESLRQSAPADVAELRSVVVREALHRVRGGTPLRAEVVEALEKVSCSLPVSVSLCHGDFVPWNIKGGKGGQLNIIDWESAWYPGPAGYDLYYYLTTTAVVLGKRINLSILRTYLTERLGYPKHIHGEVISFFAAIASAFALGRGDERLCRWHLARSQAPL